MRRIPPTRLTVSLILTGLATLSLSASSLAETCVAVAASVNVTVSQEAEAEPPDSLETLQQELQVCLQRFYEAYAAAPEPKDASVFEEHYPKSKDFVPRALEVAARAEGSDQGMEALLWALNSFSEPDVFDQVLPVLGRHFGGRSEMKGVCETLIYSDTESAEVFLESVVADHPDREVRGVACYALARQMASKVETARVVASDPEIRMRVVESRGEEYLDALGAPADLEAMAKERFQRVVDEYEGVLDGRGTEYAERAGRDLFEMEHLVVGKPAPEIEGEDIDGISFKLSDYRGKVVFLDFWGDW